MPAGYINAFDYGDGAGAQADQNVGAQARGTVFVLALHAHQHADQHGDKNADRQLRGRHRIGNNRIKTHSNRLALNGVFFK